jgi:hypothetical protein
VVVVVEGAVGSAPSAAAAAAAACGVSTPARPCC